jgi:hypothetical protein
MQVKVQEKIGSCGCGRSPTGDCCGWHALSEDQYREKLAQYEIKNVAVQQEINRTESLDDVKDLLEGTDGDVQD